MSSPVHHERMSTPETLVEGVSKRWNDNTLCLHKDSTGRLAGAQVAIKLS